MSQQEIGALSASDEQEKMESWITEPREPLIVRDGRPFDPRPGAVASTLSFPFPSTTAGVVRSQAGKKKGIFHVARQDLPKLKKLQVRGPLLVRHDSSSDTWKLLVPAPADALLLEEKDMLSCKQQVPLTPFAGGLFEHPTSHAELALVGPAVYKAIKPAPEQPAFWYWEMFCTWLSHPEAISTDLHREELGLSPLKQEQRTHVAMEPGLKVGREGALFTTRGLEFSNHPYGSSQKGLNTVLRLALWLEVQPDTTTFSPIQEGLTSMGGERRVVHWYKSSTPFPVCPDTLAEQISISGFCRLILLTPACFQKGYLPDLTTWAYQNIQPALHAILMQRPQIVSGWDLDQQKAKATRRLAPAGSVFFLELPGPPDQRLVWIKHIWGRCVSDQEQDRLDGFGLAVLGNWDGLFPEMSL
jgi:CRISPR-associated protein Cmr3